MAIMSLSDYARQHGCSQPYLSKLIKLERIPVAKYVQKGKRQFPMIDSDVVNDILKHDIDPTQQRVATRAERRGTAQSVKIPVEAKAPEVTEPDDLEKTPVGGVSRNATGAGGQVFSKARGLRETYTAMIARLDYEERTNKVIKTKIVIDRWNSLAAQIKQNLLGIPSRTCANIAAAYKTIIDQVIARIGAGESVTVEQLQAVLAAVLDDKKASDMMDAEIRETLQGLADGSFN
jgi:hypothetical protein